MEINDYPKAKALLQKYIKKHLFNVVGEQDLLSLLPTEEEYLNNLVDQSMLGMLDSNPRYLYDFFDENKIEIEIYRGWKFDVDGVELDEEWNNRKDCEKAAFEYAFKKLENLK